MSKLYDKFLLNRFHPVTDESGIISDHQFDSDSNTEGQNIYSILKVIRDSLETKKFCPTAFLDVNQAFNKVYNEGLP